MIIPSECISLSGERVTVVHRPFSRFLVASAASFHRRNNLNSFNTAREVDGWTYLKPLLIAITDKITVLKLISEHEYLSADLPMHNQLVDLYRLRLAPIQSRDVYEPFTAEGINEIDFNMQTPEQALAFAAFIDELKLAIKLREDLQVVNPKQRCH